MRQEPLPAEIRVARAESLNSMKTACYGLGARAGVKRFTARAADRSRTHHNPAAIVMQPATSAIRCVRDGCGDIRHETIARYERPGHSMSTPQAAATPRRAG